MEKKIIGGNTPLFDFKSILIELGIKKSDVILLSSDVVDLGASLYRRYRKMYDWNDLINQIIEVIGDQGTLLLPTYNWGFCHGETFDWNKTPGQTGVLGNIALKRKDFKRTQHPIYSFAVWGKDQKELCDLTNISSFGKDSPFAYLESRNAKNIAIGISFESAYTFAHYIEQKSGVVNYRFEKSFTSLYIDENNEEHVRTYSMFVRYLEMDVCGVNDLIPEIYKNNAAKKISRDGIDYMVVDMAKTVPIYMDDIVNNNSRKICRYIGQ